MARCAGAEQTVEFELWDAAASGGRGRLLASGSLAVPLKALKHREEQPAELQLTPAQQGGPQAGLQASYMLQKQWTYSPT